MPKVDFSAQANGFKFSNYFINTIATLPGIGQVSTAGRCGGMSFAALDHYVAKLPLPDLTAEAFGGPAAVPPDGHPLADYIYRRQLDSFFTVTAVKLVSWTLTTDAGGWFSRGVTKMTKQDEWAKLRASIDRGMPVTLGLIKATDLSGLGHNHQVVAYGYEPAAPDGTLCVYIYDVNYRGQELMLTSAPDQPGWTESSAGHETWRGWFVQDYVAKRPPLNLNQPPKPPPAALSLAASAPSQAQPAALTVQLSRVTFLNDDDDAASHDIALNFVVAGQTWRWPTAGQNEVRAGEAYKLAKQFNLSLAVGEPLNVEIRSEVSDSQAASSDSTEASPLDPPTGAATRQFTAADGWGAGDQVLRGSGPGGAFAVSLTIRSGG